MKREELFEMIGTLEDDIVRKSEKRIRRKRHSPWLKWGSAAACLAVLAGVVTIMQVMNLNPHKPIPGTEDDHTQPGTVQIAEEEPFVDISSLLAVGNLGQETTYQATVQLGSYEAVYGKVNDAGSPVLENSTGKTTVDSKDWYQVSGHEDLQYLIRKEDSEYSLWKFQYFQSEEYPYQDVLELVYRIDSAEDIKEIISEPADMDNTDAGKAIQAEIGTQKIADKGEIDTLYQILSSMTCYGNNHWDLIGLGDDSPEMMQNAVCLGRYLTMKTEQGAVIDGLKYTAVSGMFYEYEGVAYNKLEPAQAETIQAILKIEPMPEPDSQSAPSAGSGEKGAETLVPSAAAETAGNGNEAVQTESGTAGASSAYLEELQQKITRAMVNKELPFVVSSAVMEQAGKIKVIVTTNSEEELKKLKALDTVGGTLDIEYQQNGAIVLE